LFIIRVVPTTCNCPVFVAVDAPTNNLPVLGIYAIPLAAAVLIPEYPVLVPTKVMYCAVAVATSLNKIRTVDVYGRSVVKCKYTAFMSVILTYSVSCDL